jgi:hypothetical protein
MSIEKMMCLSTGHVTQQTAEDIGSLFNLGVPPKWAQRMVAYPHGEYGWLICIAGDTVDHIDLVNDGVPEELYGVMKHAHAHDCEWILFDRDAELIDELPSFDW